MKLIAVTSQGVLYVDTILEALSDSSIYFVMEWTEDKCHYYYPSRAEGDTK